MHISREQVKIIASIVIAGAMIGISFWLSNTKPKLASALSTDELLRAYVEQDTDADGLPDWQEEIYGTDPGNPQSVEPGITDAEALKGGLVKPAYESAGITDEEVSPPFIPGKDPASGSLTERFSTQFAEAYFAAGGGTNVSEAEQQQIINSLLETFVRQAENAVNSSYTQVSLRLTPQTSIDEYVSDVTEVLIRNDVPVEDANPLLLAEQLLQGQEDKVLPKILRLQKTYENTVSEMLLIKTPAHLSNSHLLMVRGFDGFSKATRALSMYASDPLAALGALSAYETNSNSILLGFKEIAENILKEGEPVEGTAEARIVNFVRNSEKQ